jgi:RNA:NAD 2'-phosphotransferase (TPT1/KptA family)
LRGIKRKQISKTPVNKSHMSSSLSSTSSLTSDNFPTSSMSVLPVGLTIDQVVPLSKACSGLLRHHLDAFSTLDPEGSGFVLVSELLVKLNEKSSFPVSREMVEFVVQNNDKKRIEMTGDRIRCSQGHSSGQLKDEAVYSEIVEPLTGVFHVTDRKSLKFIEQTGLNRMGRHKIHFAQESHLLRKGKSVYIEVDMAKAMQAGIKFHRSTNNVILSEGINGIIPFEFLTVHYDLDDNKIV